MGLAQPTLRCSTNFSGVQPGGPAYARSRRELLGGSAWEPVDLTVDDILPQISNPKTNLKISWIGIQINNFFFELRADEKTKVRCLITSLKTPQFRDDDTCISFQILLHRLIPSLGLKVNILAT